MLDIPHLEDVYYSSRYLEGAILVYLKNIGVVAPNKDLDARDKMNRGVMISLRVLMLKTLIQVNTIGCLI